VGLLFVPTGGRPAERLDDAADELTPDTLRAAVADAAMKRVALLALIPVLAGGTALAGQVELPKTSANGLTAEVIRAAKIAFALTVLTIHEVTRQDNTFVYAIASMPDRSRVRRTP
jgi:hypothetical protein